MNPPLVVALFVLVTFSSLSSAQLPATNVPVNTAPKPGLPQTAITEKAPSQLSVPIVADYPNQILTLTIECPARMHFPTAAAANIFGEIVRD